MKDWEEILKLKLADEQMPLPEGDWEWFESNRLQPMMKRRRLIRWSASIACMAVAASVALFVIPLSREPSIDNNKEYISESSSYATSVMLPDINEDEPVIVERVLARQPEKPISHEFMILVRDSLIAENEIIRLEQKQDTSNVPSMETVQINEKTGDTETSYYESILGNHRYTNRLEKNRISFAPLFRSSGGSVSSIGDFFHPSASSYSLFDHILKYAEARHYIPISVGVELRIMAGMNLSVTSGADVSLYRSRFTVDKETITQNAYYLGIPLRLDWTIWQDDSVSAWIGGGGKVDRLVYGKFGSDRVKDNTLNWSIVGDLGIQYDLSKNVGLFLAPEMSYYFKPENPVLQTYRTENPLVFTVGAGLRFSF